MPRQAFLFLLLVAIACSPQSEEISRPRTVSLIELAGEARVTAPTARLQLRDKESGPLLVDGWTRNKRRAWSGGQPAVVHFFAGWMGPRQLTIRCRLAKRSPPPVKMEVRVNDTSVGTVTPKSWEEFNLELPAQAVRSGWNRLTFVVAPASKESRVIEWAFVDVGGMLSLDMTPLRVDAAAQSLVLAGGHQAEFYFDLPAQSLLTVDGVRFLGDDCAALNAYWRPLGQEEREVLALSRQGEQTAVVTIDGGPGSLILRSVAKSAQGCDAVALRSPRLAMPEPTHAVVARPTQRQAKNVVFFLVDTLRADHLGAYGYAKPTSPELDRFASDGTLFLNSHAQSSWTRSSVASIFTGLLPQQHKANRQEDGLADEATTLAEVLTASGFETAGFSANGNAAQGVNFDQGFKTWKLLGRSRSEAIIDATTAWLRSRDGEKPFFLWVHTIDPHAPYVPPAEFRDLLAPPGTNPELGAIETFSRFQRGELGMTPEVIGQLVGLYDAEIRNNDRAFGSLLAELESLGLTDETIVVFLSDHGEEFAEHGGWSHGKTLFAEMLETPLVIRFPDLARGQRPEFAAQHIDLLPTILDYFGIDLPGGLSGESLLPRLETGMALDQRSVVSNLDLRGRVMSSVVLSDWKYILPDASHMSTSLIPMLFRRDLDPAEQTSVLDLDGETARTLETLLTASSQHWGPALDPVLIDLEEAKLRDELKALGYIN